MGDESDWQVTVASSSARSSTGSVVVEARDRRVQEDSRRVTFRGSGEVLSQVYMQSEYPGDLTAIADAGGALTFEFRVVEKPTSRASLRMDCHYPCSGAVNFTRVLLQAPTGEWTKKAVPIDCFVKEGLEVRAVNTPFLLATEGDMTIDISAIELEAEPAISSMVSCADLVNDKAFLTP